MTILLDFDMDFFVRPIHKEARDNHRDYLNEPTQLQPMEDFFKMLESKNLRWEQEDVKLFTNHKKSYTFWWTRKYKDCTLIHIDAHSDFYRPKGRDLMSMGNHEITCYNFIWYAVRDGYVNNIYWVIPEDHELMVRLEKFIALAMTNSLPLPLSIDFSPDLSNDNPLLTEAIHIIRQTIDPRMPCRGTLSNSTISLDCPVNTVNGELLLKIIICTAKELPKFSESIQLVTAATSPEFISAEADQMIPEFCHWIKASEALCTNIKMQHEDMSSSI